MFDEEPEAQISTISFHSHNQLFEIPGAIQLKDYLYKDSAWHNCTPDLISIKFQNGKKAKVTDYIIGPNDAHIYILYHFHNCHPRSNLYIIDSTTETTENFYLFQGQLNNYKNNFEIRFKSQISSRLRLKQRRCTTPN